MPEPCGVHVLPEVLDEPVVCRHMVLLTALLVEQECPLVVAEPVVLHVHRDDRSDAAEGVEHGRDYRAVAEDRRPAGANDVPRSLDRSRRVGLERAPGDHPVEAPADCGEVLPDRGA